MKLTSPASERNKEPILTVLRDLGVTVGRALELNAGSGQHSVHFAAAFPELEWQPTDIDGAALSSIAAHRTEARLDNLRAPLRLDVREPRWGDEPHELILSINMLHIAPWDCSEALFAGAGRALSARGLLVTYGPYNIDGRFTSPSNAAFDASLRSRNASWGIRDLDQLGTLAAAAGLVREQVIAMPANNFVLVHRRDGAR